jgi:hypothetical protein
MKHAVEIGSGAMIYIPGFMNIGSGILMLIGDIHRHREHGDPIILILFYFLFGNKESRLKINVFGCDSMS